MAVESATEQEAKGQAKQDLKTALRLDSGAVAGQDAESAAGKIAMATPRQDSEATTGRDTVTRIDVKAAGQHAESAIYTVSNNTQVAEHCVRDGQLSAYMDRTQRQHKYGLVRHTIYIIHYSSESA